MSVNEFGNQPVSGEPDRPVLSSAMRGLTCKCPSCGKGGLFERGLQVHHYCKNCGEELHFHRADDLPAYLNIFIIGHVVVAAAIIAMDMELFGMWTLVILSSLLAVALALLLLRPLKGMVVGLQWALRMHGFGGDHD